VENRSHLDHDLNPLLGPLDDLADPPALRLRQRTAGDDLHHVADVAPVLLVVGVELLGHFPRPVVEPVRGRGRDRDDDRLLHLVAHHAPPLDLPAAPLSPSSCPPPPPPWPAGRPGSGGLSGAAALFSVP